MSKQPIKIIKNNEDFVVAWQSSGTLAEVAKRVGTSLRNASSHATWLRTRGVPLKKFSTRNFNVLDVEGLSALANKTAKEKK